MLQAFLGRPEIAHLAAGNHDKQAVAEVQVGDAVRDHDDSPAIVRKASHHFHD
jgi:hypothetical protein